MLGPGRGGQLATLRRLACHSNVAGRRTVGALEPVDVSAADRLDWPPDRPWTEARCSPAFAPNLQGLRQKPCACSSRLTRNSDSGWISGGGASGSDDGKGGAALTCAYCLPCCQTANLSASIASRAVVPKAWTLISHILAAKPPPQENTQNRGAPATPSRRCRLDGPVAGLADGSTSQPARADQVRHGPPQAPCSSEPLRRSASAQVACRWVLLARGSVQCQRHFNFPHRGVRRISWTGYAASPRSFRCSMGLRKPSELLIRSSLYQRMYASSVWMNWSTLVVSQSLR